MGKKEFPELTEDELSDFINYIKMGAADFAQNNLMSGLSDCHWDIYTAIEKAIMHEWKINQPEYNKRKKENKITENTKPPLGVIPHPLWVETRIFDLADIVLKYIKEGRAFEPIVHDWAKELASLTNGELL